ncbi:MAG: hypothetical protein ACPHUL_09885, partial [Marinomonas gallaica]
AIVKHVLIHHNAKLQIRSQPGFGSTFSCHFPTDRVRQEALLATVADSIDAPVKPLAHSQEQEEDATTETSSTS